MTKIRTVKSINIISSEASSVAFHPRLTILTGHNGAGKSTLITAIYSALTVYPSPLLEDEAPSHRERWGVDVGLESGFHLVALKAKFIQSLKEKGFEDVVQELLMSEGLEAGLSYALGFSEHQREVKAAVFPHHFYDEGNADLQVFKTLYPGFDFDQNTKSIEFSRAVLYMDERFYESQDRLTSSRNEIKNIYAEGSGLDGTLHNLLTRFAQTIANQRTGLQVEHVDDILQQIKSALLSTKNVKNSYAKTVKKLEHLVEAREKDLSDRLSYDEFFLSANGFFEQTDRALCLDDRGSIAIRLNNDPENLISWVYLSKGEKTLLILLITAYLERRNSIVFLLDEPDLSLHIGWQKILMPTLLKLSPKSQFIITTHSPAMVGNTDDEKIVNLLDAGHNV
ncbi:MAG: AAA family ATPase [Halothiobacillaceae bacterium]